MNLTLPTVDVSSARAELAELGPRAKSAISDFELPKVNLSRAQIPDLDHAGQTVTSALSGAGQAMSGALEDAGHLVSGALAAAGERLKDLRPAPEPKRRSLTPLAVGGVVLGAAALAVAAAAAVLLDPIQGARRRAAARRRVETLAARLRQGRGTRESTQVTEEPPTDDGAQLQSPPAEVPETAVEMEYSEDAVLVSAGVPSSQNGVGHISDAAVAEAGGE